MVIIVCFGMAELGETELLEPHPDILALFLHYNSLYFDDALGACFVSWSSSRMTSCAGTCTYLPGGGCEIRLSEPLLKYRPTSDLKNTLLHEMIHAFLWLMSNNKDHSDHGPTFKAQMHKINLSTITDFQRPPGGYHITAYHEFHNEVNNYRVHHWKCELCGDLIKRAMNREPSANDCIQRRGHDNSCNNPQCHWHGHKKKCSGKYVKIAEPPGYKGKSKVAKGESKNDGNVSAGPSCTIGDAENSKDSSDAHKYEKITKFFSPGSRIKPDSRSSEDKARKNEKMPECKIISTENKKPSKRKREINVAIPWLGYYADEESEEDVEPLVNKRSERRKKESERRKLKRKHLDTEITDNDDKKCKSLDDGKEVRGNSSRDIVVYILDD